MQRDRNGAANLSHVPDRVAAAEMFRVLRGLPFISLQADPSAGFGRFVPGEGDRQDFAAEAGRIIRRRAPFEVGDEFLEQCCGRARERRFGFGGDHARRSPPLDPHDAAAYLPFFDPKKVVPKS